MSSGSRKDLSRRVHVLLSDEIGNLLKDAPSCLHTWAVLYGLADKTSHDTPDVIFGEEKKLIEKGLVDLGQVPLGYLSTRQEGLSVAVHLLHLIAFSS